MKTSLLSVIAALTLLSSGVASATTLPIYPKAPRTEDVRRMSPAERARYEAAKAKAERERERQLAQEKAHYEAQQRKLAQERARLEVQRRADERKATERARYEAQHHNDRHDGPTYHGR